MKLGLGLGFGKQYAIIPDSVAASVVLNISEMSIVDNEFDYFGVGDEGSGRLREISISADGTRLIAIDQAGDKIYSYTMSTGWDLSTITKDSAVVTMADLGDNEANPQMLFVKPDGTKLYYGGFGNDTIYQYSMSTPWDISTLSSDSKTLSLTGNSLAFFISSDGMHAYAADPVLDSFGYRQYDLSTAWDISTASDSGNTFIFTDLGAGPIWITNDGTKLVHASLDPDDFTQWSFGTPWDLSTLTQDSGETIDYSGETLALVGSAETHCSGFMIKPDDYSTLIMAGGILDFMFQFSK